MKKGGAFVFLLSIVLTVANGQSAQPTTLTFKEAMQISLDKNVILNTQRNNLYSAQAQKLLATAAFLPSIGAYAQYSTYNGQGQDPNNGDFVKINYNSSFGNIGATLVLFNGFARTNTFLRAENQLMAQTSFIERAKQDAIFTVSNQYLLVLLDQELLRIAQENHQYQAKLLEQIQGMVDVGQRPAVDVYNQDAITKNFEVQAIRAGVTLQNDKALLAQLLQLDPSQEFQVTTPELTVDQDFLNQNTLEKLYEIAISNRPDLRQATYQIGANKYAMRSTVAGYMPTISATAQYGSQWSSVFQGSFSEQAFKNNPNYTYGFNINIPIFDRLATRTNHAVARINYENSVLTRNNLEKTVKIDVQRSYKNFVAAVENARASEAQFKAGELALQTQRESYELGIATQVTLAIANQTFVQGSAAKAQADVTLMFQKILLEYALGILNPDELAGK